MAASNATTMVAAVVTALDKVSVIGKRAGSWSTTGAAGTHLGATLAEHALAIQNHKTNIDSFIATPGTQTIPLDRCKLPTLLPLAATASSGVFGLAAGTFCSTVSPTLIGEASNSSAKTDYTRFEVVLPADYIAGQAVTFVIRAKLSASTASTTKTLDLIINMSDKEGGASAVLATGAQAITTAYANYTFTPTATNLVPGAVLDCEIVGILNDTHATGVITIGDIRMTYARVTA
jgi:hypothetical protein